MYPGFWGALAGTGIGALPPMVGTAPVGPPFAPVMPVLPFDPVTPLAPVTPFEPEVPVVPVEPVEVLPGFPEPVPDEPVLEVPPPPGWFPRSAPVQPQDRRSATLAPARSP